MGVEQVSSQDPLCMRILGLLGDDSVLRTAMVKFRVSYLAARSLRKKKELYCVKGMENSS